MARSCDAERGEYGGGTVYQKADGRWTGQLRLPGGVRKTYYGSSEKEVRGKLRSARRAYDAGLLAAAPSLSVHDYLSGWLERVVAPSVRPKTLEAARLNVKRVNRLVGRARLEALTAPSIQALYSSLLESGLVGAFRRAGARGLAPRTASGGAVGACWCGTRSTLCRLLGLATERCERSLRLS